MSWIEWTAIIISIASLVISLETIRLNRKIDKYYKRHHGTGKKEEYIKSRYPNHFS